MNSMDNTSSVSKGRKLEDSDDFDTGPPAKRKKVKQLYSNQHHQNHYEIVSTTDSYHGFDRTQITRLLIQALYDLGHTKVAQRLEQDSGCLIETPPISKLRQAVLSGKWEQGEDIVKCLELDSDHEIQAIFALRRQHYLELVESNQQEKALNILRTKLATMEFKDRHVEIERLSKVIVGDENSFRMTRKELLNKLQGYLSPTLVLPPHRLAMLLKQVQAYQSMTTNSSTDNSYSLYTDSVASGSGGGPFASEAKQVIEAHEDEVWALEFGNGGRILATGAKDGSVKVWKYSLEQKQWLEHWKFEGSHTQGVVSLAWSKDDSTLISGGRDRVKVMYDIVNGQIADKNTTAHQDVISCCAWVNNDQYLTGCPDHEMILWNKGGGIEYKWDDIRVMNLALTPDNNQVAVVKYDNTIAIYDLTTKEMTNEIHVGKTMTSIDISSDWHMLVSLTPGDLYLWDLKSRRIVRKYVGQLQDKFYIRSAFGGVNQQYVISGSEDCGVYIWNRFTSELIDVLQGHSAPINTARWCPVEPCMLASASDDHTVRIWRQAE